MIRQPEQVKMTNIDFSRCCNWMWWHVEHKHFFRQSELQFNIFWIAVNIDYRYDWLILSCFYIRMRVLYWRRVSRNVVFSVICNCLSIKGGILKTFIFYDGAVCGEVNFLVVISSTRKRFSIHTKRVVWTRDASLGKSLNDIALWYGCAVDLIINRDAKVIINLLQQFITILRIFMTIIKLLKNQWAFTNSR